MFLTLRDPRYMREGREASAAEEKRTAAGVILRAIEGAHAKAVDMLEARADALQQETMGRAKPRDLAEQQLEATALQTLVTLAPDAERLRGLALRLVQVEHPMAGPVLCLIDSTDTDTVMTEALAKQMRAVLRPRVDARLLADQKQLNRVAELVLLRRARLRLAWRARLRAKATSAMRGRSSGSSRHRLST